MGTLYHITRRTKVYYDEQREVVVEAEDQEKARLKASQSAGDEGPKAWLDQNLTVCKPIGRAFWNSKGLICRDFKAG